MSSNIDDRSGSPRLDEHGNVGVGLDPTTSAATPSEMEEGLIAPQVPIRSVAFPEVSAQDGPVAEKPHHHPHMHRVNTEMRRELTVEERELAAAGYEHLERGREQSTKVERGGGGVQAKDVKDFSSVDITEHAIPLASLAEALRTSFDTASPSTSKGLGEEEVQQKLERDGRNVLTPGKRKSAFRKVGRLQVSSEYTC
jgi:sodium/potassium-transporting ATPase subunit alpha